MGRIVEAFIGEYASGKSENAVNRALHLVQKGRQVTLVDLDTVEPCYTLRPIKRELEAEGMTVLAWETSETIGLGEAGSVLKPEMRWALRREGDIVMDIGYGVHGASIFNLIEGADSCEELRILGVINISRPMTMTVPLIVDYVREIGRVDGLINNTHFGDETTVVEVQRGSRMVEQAARELGIPMIATSIMADLATEIGPTDERGYEVWPLRRFMPKSFW